MLSVCVAGTILVCSTYEQNLDMYEVYYSDGHWMKPIVDHEWYYIGRVHSVFDLARHPTRRPADNASMRTIFPTFEEGYLFRNYDGGVTLYSREMADFPVELYRIYYLDVEDPIDFHLSEDMIYGGRRLMIGWA